MDEGLGDHAALGQLGLDPVRVHIAAEAGDELVLPASLEVQVAICVEFAQVASGPPLAGEGRLAQVAEQGAAADLNLAIIGQAHPHMGQWPADTAGTVGARPVEADHRGAFGEAIALEHR
ncbi:hypothetical protein D3C72_1776970 [compost metagenome]